MTTCTCSECSVCLWSEGSTRGGNCSSTATPHHWRGACIFTAFLLCSFLQYCQGAAVKSPLLQSSRYPALRHCHTGTSSPSLELIPLLSTLLCSKCDYSSVPHCSHAEVGVEWQDPERKLKKEEGGEGFECSYKCSSWKLYNKISCESYKYV